MKLEENAVWKIRLAHAADLEKTGLAQLAQADRIRKEYELQKPQQLGGIAQQCASET